MKIAVLLAPLCLGGAAMAAECRPGDLPPGLGPDRVAACRPAAKGASKGVAERPEEGRPRAGSRPGFIDFGNGTEVRIGGRVGFEVEGRR